MRKKKKEKTEKKGRTKENKEASRHFYAEILESILFRGEGSDMHI